MFSACSRNRRGTIAFGTLPAGGHGICFTRATLWRRTRFSHHRGGCRDAARAACFGATAKRISSRMIAKRETRVVATATRLRHNAGRIAYGACVWVRFLPLASRLDSGATSSAHVPSAAFFFRHIIKRAAALKPRWFHWRRVSAAPSNAPLRIYARGKTYCAACAHIHQRRVADACIARALTSWHPPGARRGHRTGSAAAPLSLLRSWPHRLPRGAQRASQHSTSQKALEGHRKIDHSICTVRGAVRCVGRISVVLWCGIAFVWLGISRRFRKRLVASRGSAISPRRHGAKRHRQAQSFRRQIAWWHSVTRCGACGRHISR